MQRVVVFTYDCLRNFFLTFVTRFNSVKKQKLWFIKTAIKVKMDRRKKIFAYQFQEKLCSLARVLAAPIAYVKSVSYFVIWRRRIRARFKPSDNTLNYLRVKKQPLFYFLRKSKLFNKGRYSRNRQIYRTGAYWCFWVNILAVTGFYYWFYRFSMNFGYLWPFFSLFVISFILPKALKFNYLHFLNLAQSLLKLIKWFFLLLSSAFELFFTKYKLFQQAEKVHLVFLLPRSLLSFTFIFLLKLKNTFLATANFVSFSIIDQADLFLKSYSHWNYFLPLRWIRRNHRSFFYYRVLHIILDSKVFMG